MKKFLSFIVSHKLITGIALLVIVVGGYFGYGGLAKDKTLASYITAVAAKGTLIVSVSGTGQVSASNQIDIKPKVSGDVVNVKIKNGQEVKSGDLLIQLDSGTAQKELRDAQTALETAKLDLAELLNPPDELTLMQAENALTGSQDTLTKLKFTQTSDYQDAQKAIETAEDNLEKGYEDAFNAIVNAFLDLPTVVTDLDNILYSYEIADSEVTVSNVWNKAALISAIPASYSADRQKIEQYVDDAESDYQTAKIAYDSNFEDYKNASRYSENEAIELLLEETKETAKLIAEAVKSQSNMLDYWVNSRSEKNLSVFSKVTVYQSNLNFYTSDTNGNLSSLLSIQGTIEDNKDAKLNAERDLVEMEQNNPLNLAAAERTVKEKEAALADLKAGADELEIRAKKIAIQQEEDALLTAQQDLAEYYIRAPFDGLVASLDVEKGETVSSGNAAVTLVTKQQIAEIELNEVDVSKVAVGQKVTLSFDAVEDLSVTGSVAEIDTIGTVSQGVVSYVVKIAFDTQDDRIKSGMSVSADIITEAKTDVLSVSSAAVKSQSNGEQYVETLVDGQPQRKTVTTGISNDTMIEIITGLSEGEQIITQTINSGSQTGSVQNTQSNRQNNSVGNMMRFTSPDGH